MEKAYAYYDVETIKAIPIETILQDYGIVINNGMFKIRDERTASCKMYPETNTWADFGGADVRGGSVIQLVQALDDVEWRDAIQVLGARYNVPSIANKDDVGTSKTITPAQYKKIGIETPAYKNILRVERAETFSYEDIQSIRQRYDISMNQLFVQEPSMYQKILADEALPLLKEQRTLYYKALYHLYKEQSSGYNGPMMPVAQAMAKQVYEDYDAAYRIMCAAAAGTDIKVGKYKANFEKDLSQITKKSFEIGDYPYAALKELPGETHHITMPLEQYEDTTKHSAAAQLDEPYSVFLKGEEVTVSFKAAHEPIIKSAFLKNDGESIPVANRRPRQTTYEIE